jgi:hypothetical protein
MKKTSLNGKSVWQTTRERWDRLNEMFYLECMDKIHNVMAAYYLDVKEHAMATRDPLDGTKPLNSVGGELPSYGLKSSCKGNAGACCA